MLDRTEQAIADVVREVFDGHCGTGARVDPERPSWEQVGREVVAGLAAEGGVVVWTDDEAVVERMARARFTAAWADPRVKVRPSWESIADRTREKYRGDAAQWLECLSLVSAETTESET